MRVENRIDRNRDRALFEKASAATCLLSEVFGGSADRVSVEWAPVAEQGPGDFRQAARLQLSDPFSGIVATTPSLRTNLMTCFASSFGSTIFAETCSNCDRTVNSTSTNGS